MWSRVHHRHGPPSLRRPQRLHSRQLRPSLGPQLPFLRTFFHPIRIHQPILQKNRHKRWVKGSHIQSQGPWRPAWPDHLSQPSGSFLQRHWPEEVLHRDGSWRCQPTHCLCCSVVDRWASPCEKPHHRICCG